MRLASHLPPLPWHSLHCCYRDVTAPWDDEERWKTYDKDGATSFFILLCSSAPSTQPRPFPRRRATRGRTILLWSSETDQLMDQAIIGTYDNRISSSVECTRSLRRHSRQAIMQSVSAIRQLGWTLRSYHIRCLPILSSVKSGLLCWSTNPEGRFYAKRWTNSLHPMTECMARFIHKDLFFVPPYPALTNLDRDEVKDSISSKNLARGWLKTAQSGHESS